MNFFVRGSMNFVLVAGRGRQLRFCTNIEMGLWQVARMAEAEKRKRYRVTI
jgi:hypothetical protein